jgi:1-acyl-sn-glycerol-3-phosphate acyltransferase
MIPVHRGEPDRATLKSLLAVLAGGQALLIAPEGRESHTGQLEAAKGGPAFLAQQAGVPALVIVPVAITGTAWKHVLPAWRRLRRPCVTLTFGEPYTLPPGLNRRQATDAMMRRLAALLPPDYRGVYAEA